MNAQDYYESLNEAQQTAVKAALDRAEMLGLKLMLTDAVDIWFLIPRAIRGDKPEYRVLN